MTRRRRGSRGRRRRRCTRRRARSRAAVVGQPALACRPSASSARSDAQQRQHGLGLGVAEADVVLDEPGPVGGQHQAGVEHADVRRAGGGEVVEHRLHERAPPARRPSTAPAPARRRPCRPCWGRCRPRRCACGPGPAAAAEARGAVAQRQQRALRARSSAPRARTAPPAARMAASVSASSTGTVTPLPAASPSSLTTTGRPRSRHHASGGVDVAAGERANAGPGMPSDVGQLAGAALRRLQPGEGGRRAEARHAPLGAAVGDAGDERGLGPGDHEVAASWSARSSTRRDQRHVVAVAPAGPGDRLLPPAAADDGDPHRPSEARHHARPRCAGALRRARPRSSAWPGPRRPRAGSGR